ncbi:urea ABC transporter permease subunit UrtB [Solirhodobacter olei]|uniref:urea ABC transporter permease subunit UrtB n=1 Tax=Solirhodobacter olei TaxID=2493082 RepID=UPI000FD88E57|nr:urea ABC transporter permease subunit UrtB [Solirhodobacter olei]
MTSLLRAVLTICALLYASVAVADDFSALVQALPKGSYHARSVVVKKLGLLGDARAVPVLKALNNDDLKVAGDGTVLIVNDTTGAATSAIGGAAMGKPDPNSLDRVKANNMVRRAIRTAIGMLTLRDPDPAKRMKAAEDALKAADPEQIDALDAAISAERDAGVKAVMAEARAAAVLKSDAPEAQKLAAIHTLGDRGDNAALAALVPVANSKEPALAQAAKTALSAIREAQQFWRLAQNIWFGLSLGSVLLLAAVGLAITFGVMGVINMAHGELVMLGAYTTFVVQQVIRADAPGLFGWSLAIAAPLAFLVSGAVGIAIERGIVRHLYGRPLETLLATWGVSLILQQAVRTIFGPDNRDVGNPGWMSGAFKIGQMQVTWNRLWILIFCLAVFAVLLAVLKKTPIGLQMRAVTQNRAMAANMGIRTGGVDALTFGLGAGIAGLAGVALSQVDNVSPNLGQNYIVDSFMVVVFGGAGNIWGTLAGAFTLGIANKFLEPFSGAVLAKILILVGIILFIQKRPRGLFAVKGRAVES